VACATVGVAAAQTTTTTTEVKNFTVVSVDGNKLVAKDRTGAREYTVPPDFRFTVDGKSVSIAEIKPGMTGTATITTTTTAKPVVVTEVRSGTVVQVSGNSMIVRTPNGIKNFTEGEVEKRGVTIVKDGKPAQFSDFHAGDQLTATIVTEGPPKPMTERQVQATLSGAAPPPPAAKATTGSAAAATPPPASSNAAPVSSSRNTAGAAATPAPASPPPAKELPRTASNLPLFGATALSALAAALLLSLVRRRRELR
jgi:hypothetical protein